MASARTLAIAGAGIGGLTAALALNRIGCRIILFEREAHLAEVGAGLQLSPNASRVLIGLGLEQPLTAVAVAPAAIGIINARNGREIARVPLGDKIRARYGAPYWLLHRPDLQAVLLAKVQSTPGIELRLGWQFDDVATDETGVAVTQRRNMSRRQDHVQALIGADGAWSAVRRQVFPDIRAQFSGRIAWRGMIDAARVPDGFDRRRVQLRMGADAHLVAYPMAGTGNVNLVAIVNDEWRRPGWNEPGDPAEIVRHFAAWHEGARAMIAAVASWRKWALYEVPAGAFAKDRIAMLGDAAHAMLPFAAQGAAMAIEDAAVLARCIETQPGDVAAALRQYERLRRTRVAQVQRASRRNGQIYHLKGASGFARDRAMRLLGGARLLARQDWIYGWRA
ncbi:3-hydroxybenzoate 6-hydroxylase OS=Afipia felis OX=1035 GN=mhbM PE=4 SV=1 [Afipia felis]